MLTYAANSRYVAYLDDDNWVDETHISRLLAAIQGRDWAFSLRWYVDPVTQQPLAVDRWESVGPDEGAFKKKFGGFVDPSCLMIDKTRCPHVPPLWTVPLRPRTPTADRIVFEALRQSPAVGPTGAATAYYVLNPQDENHPIRLGWIKALQQEEGDAALGGVTPMSQEWNRTHGLLQR
jgi:hypothetical protein